LFDPDVNARKNDGWTPVGEAQKQDKSDVVQFLAAHDGHQ
jgi:hypothetical protein